MSEKKLRELDAWIAEHVFGCKPQAVRIMEGRKLVRVEYHCKCTPSHVVGWSKIYSYTTNPAASMELLKKCAMRCGEIMVTYNGMFAVHGALPRAAKATYGPSAPTLELAIAQFAIKLCQTKGVSDLLPQA